MKKVSEQEIYKVAREYYAMELNPETETDPQLIKLARAMLEQDLLAEGGSDG